MTDEKKPRYSLRPRSKSFTLICEGVHCMAAVCTNTVRGKYDAELIVLALNQYAEKTEGKAAR